MRCGQRAQFVELRQTKVHVPRWQDDRMASPITGSDLGLAFDLAAGRPRRLPKSRDPIVQ